MKTLFLDIETLPADEASRDALGYLYERKQEKSRKKAGTTEGAAVPATVDAKDFEQFLLGTSFDGAFGRILCIGYAVDDEPTDVLTGDECDILRRFWELARTVRRFVGHNVMDFDLRFIYQRSIVCGVRPSVDLGLIDRASKKLRRFAPPRPRRGKAKPEQTRKTVNHVTGP